MWKMYIINVDVGWCFVWFVFSHPAQMRIPIDLGLWSDPENLRASDNLNNP